MSSSYFERDVWADPERLKDWHDRELTFDVFQEIINDACVEFVEAHGPNVEIGSGLGALGDYVTAVPIHAHVEGNFPTAQEHRAKINPNGQIYDRVVNGDLYNLPFRNESVGSVMGLLVIDAMFDMRETMKECSRVLRPNGTFVYFHDAAASLNATGTFIKQDGNLPVPISPRHIAAFEDRDIRRFVRLARRQWRNSEFDIDLVMEDLMFGEVQFDYWRMQEPDLVDAITKVVEGNRKLRRTILPHVTDVFGTLLAQSAEEAGLKVIRNAAVQRDTLISIEEAQRRGLALAEGQNAVILSSFGNSGIGTIDNVPAGQVAVGLEVLTFIARK